MTTDIDFFSADAAGAKPEGEPREASATSAAAGPQTEQMAKPKKARWQDRVGGKHFLIVGVLVVSGWVVWPLLGGGNSQSIPIGTPLQTSPSVNAVPPPQSQVAAASATAAAPRPADVERSDRETPDNDEIVALRTALAVQEERQQVLLAGQQELKANLVVLMTQVKQLNDAAEAKKAAKAPAPPKRAARQASVKAPASVPGLKLNTVYPGQAWIDAPQGKTYIVQVGDIVEGARVLSIDEGARVVQTTRGPIQ